MRKNRMWMMVLGLLPFYAIAAMTDERWVGSVSVGPIWEHAGKQQTLMLAPDVEKTYDPQNSTHGLVNGELFLGLQKILSPRVKGQLGLAVAGTSEASLAGDIWDDADPLFDNYNYSYQVQHTHLALKGILLLDCPSSWVMPWISASVGVGFNHAYGFSNTPTIFEAVVSPNFSSHTQTSVTYTLGMGVQKALTEHWQAGLGYQFADWGKSQLGKAPGQTSGNGLMLNHLYTNGILFNLTYLS